MERAGDAAPALFRRRDPCPPDLSRTTNRCSVNSYARACVIFGQTVRLIPVEDILYFQSDEKYTRVALEDSEVLIGKPIKELLEELDPVQFWQIHRSTLVNTRAIASMVRGMRDQADLKLKGRPETLTVSRNFTHLFKQM